MWDLPYNELYKLSIDHPEKYWDEVAKDIVWSTPYTSVLEDKDSLSPRWYVGGELNMSYNCLDKQVEDGYGEDVAVIHDSFYTGLVTKLTYNELLKDVELLAGVMVHKCGLVKGDRVLLYFPMIPQCLIAMLACTRIGAISTTVFGGFATKELGARIQYFEPKLIISCNVGLEPGIVIDYKERIDNALRDSGYALNYSIIYNRTNFQNAILQKGRDLDWSIEIKEAKPQKWIPVESGHPQFVAFTSGTTGEPKGIVKTTGGAVVQNMSGLKRKSRLKPGEVWWTISDFGWILGQSLLSYAPLMSRNPTIIYEGKAVGTLGSSQITRVLNQHKVVSFICAPTVMKLLQKYCTEDELKLSYSGLRSINLGGECVDISIQEWTSQTFKCPVYTVWSQTELGHAGILSGIGLKLNTKDDAGLLSPGLECKIVDRETGQELPRNTVGRFLLKMPLTPGSIVTLFKNNERYLRTYLKKYPGYFDTMDVALMTENGLIKVVARDDDIIHVGAARICGGALEEACLINECISDVAVVALEDNVKGFVPFAFLVTKNNINCSDSDIINKSIDLVLKNVGEVASFNKAVIVPNLPRNKSGKIPRKTLADMLNGQQYTLSSTIDNPESFLTIYKILTENGIQASLPINSL